jgi:hypothetical protein
MMVIVDWLTRYSKAMIDGQAWNNYQKINHQDSRDLLLKVGAVALAAGIITAFIVPVMAAIVAVSAGMFVFSHDCVNFDFAEAARKAARR